MVHTQSVTYVRHIATRMAVSSIDFLMRVMLGTSKLLDTQGHITPFRAITNYSIRKVTAKYGMLTYAYSKVRVNKGVHTLWTPLEAVANLTEVKYSPLNLI